MSSEATQNATRAQAPLKQPIPELRVDTEFVDGCLFEAGTEIEVGRAQAEEQDGESHSYLRVPQSHTGISRVDQSPPVPGLIRRNCMSFED